MEMSKAKAENRPLPKRFYAAANVQQIDGGFVITLDEKPVRTPGQKLLRTESKELAQQIAAEWGAQGEFIDTETMPLTRLLNIALDRIPMDRDALLNVLYGDGALDAVDRTIDVYIRRLREKLGDDPERPRYVTTVRGVGYRAAVTAR